MDIQHAIDALNAAFEQDPAAIRALLINVVPCNAALAAHPTIQCGELPDMTSVSALGLVNGVIGALGLPLIAPKWSDMPDAEGRFELLGFCAY
jgi:hypothetical protein